MIATRFLMPMVLVLGTTLQASAQQPRTTFENFGCKIDLAELPDGSVPPDLEDTVLVTVETFKQCPGSVPNPSIQMTCDLLIPEWDNAFRVNTRDITCEINGAQCGVNSVLPANNAQLTIDPVVISGEVFGDAHLRCSRNTGG
jgi:hypothetical protein